MKKIQQSLSHIRFQTDHEQDISALRRRPIPTIFTEELTKLRDIEWIEKTR